MFFEDLFIIYSIDSTPYYVLCVITLINVSSCFKSILKLSRFLCHVVSPEFFFGIHAFLFQTIS